MPEKKRPQTEERLPDLTLGKRFPRTLLNMLPRKWRREHLIQKSGGEDERVELNFSEQFQSARKLLLAWPERPDEILMAFPSARALFEALPAETECLHLCEARTSVLVQGLFPGAMIEWKNSEIAWHEPEVATLVRNLTAFHPDTILMLGQTPYPTVLQAALRCTGAPVRIGWESSVNAPFVNTRLQADPNTSLAVRGYQALGLWRYAGFSPREEWMRIQSDPDSRLIASNEWNHKRATPENTWLYVHDLSDPTRAGRILDDALFTSLEEKISTRDVPGFVLGAVLWNPANVDVTRVGAWLDAPIFNESDFPSLLAVLDGSRGAIAYNGFGLHFASLVEVRCIALLRQNEALYDSSPVNKMFEVEWV